MQPGYMYAIGAAITWGLVYTIDQRILKGASPFALLFIDSLITVIILLPLVFFQKNTLTSVFHLPLKTWFLVILSIVLAALANFCIFSGIKALGAARASIFEIMYPFFVTLFSFVVFQAVPNMWFLIGSIFIFAGTSLIILFS